MVIFPAMRRYRYPSGFLLPQTYNKFSVEVSKFTRGNRLESGGFLSERNDDY
jgi:hypothetical protein